MLLGVWETFNTELAWILNCLTPVGKLRHMTIWEVQASINEIRYSIPITVAFGNVNHESEVDIGQVLAERGSLHLSSFTGC